MIPRRKVAPESPTEPSLNLKKPHSSSPVQKRQFVNLVSLSRMRSRHRFVVPASPKSPLVPSPGSKSPLCLTHADAEEDAIEAVRDDIFPPVPARWELCDADFDRLALTADREAYLRGRIIELASGFSGTPYFARDSPLAEEHASDEAKKFYRDSPDRVDFLDCCGLVGETAMILCNSFPRATSANVAFVRTGTGAGGHVGAVSVTRHRL